MLNLTSGGDLSVWPPIQALGAARGTCVLEEQAAREAVRNANLNIRNS